MLGVGVAFKPGVDVRTPVPVAGAAAFAAELDGPGAAAGGVPPVHGLGVDADLAGELVDGHEFIAIGHVGRVRHTVLFPQACTQDKQVTQQQEDPRIHVHGANRNAHNLGTVVDLAHARFPDWWFQIGVDKAWDLVLFSVHPVGFYAGYPAPPGGREPWDAPPARGDYPVLNVRKVLRSFPVGDLHDAAVAYLRNLAEEELAATGTPGPWERVADPDPRDRKLVALAAEYVALLATEPAAAQVLAGRRGYTVAMVRRQLHEARQRGLLTKGPRGKQGGDLTDKARALLDGA